MFINQSNNIVCPRCNFQRITYTALMCVSELVQYMYERSGRAIFTFVALDLPEYVNKSIFYQKLIDIAIILPLILYISHSNTNTI